MSEEERSAEAASDEAEQAFAEYYRRRAAGEALDLDAFCRERPQVEAEIRRIERQMARVSSLLSRMGASAVSPGAADSARAAVDAAFGELRSTLRGRASAFARYRIGETLGAGGMGVVREVFDPELKRTLAMKVAAATRTSAQRVGRFLAEIQVTAQLDHPGVVPVHELGLDPEGRFYFTMRVVRGRDLSDVFAHARRGDGGWSLSRIVDVLQRVCETLAYAHSKGVVHRDLKPANVRVGRFGEVYVMDWGLAKVLGEAESGLRVVAGDNADDEAVTTLVREAVDADSPLVTREGDVLGTPAYMAPEQARGDLASVGAWTDVYALGAILYEMLAGHAPYVEGKRRPLDHEVLARNLAGPPRALATVAPGAPPELVAIADKAMAREPGDRYASIEALTADLRAWREDRKGVAWSDSTWRRTVKLVRRHPTSALATIAVAVLVAGGSIGWDRTRRAEAKYERAESDRRKGDALVELRRQVRVETDDSDPVAKLRSHADAARAELRAFADLGFVLDDASDPAALAHALNAHQPADVRRQLLEGWFDLTRHLLLSGLVQAARYSVEGRALAGALEDWQAMAEAHPDLVEVWPRVRGTVLELHGHEGARVALEIFERDVFGEASAGNPGALEPARLAPEELDFVSYVVSQTAGRSAGREFNLRGLEVDPSNFWLHHRLGTLALDEQESQTAVAHLTAALAVWPESIAARMHLGLALAGIGDLDGARRHFEVLLARGDRTSTIYTNYAHVLDRCGDLRGANECLIAALALEADDAIAIHNLARGLILEAGESNDEESEARIERSTTLAWQLVELWPRNPAAYYRLARAQQFAGDDPGAVVTLGVGLERVRGDRLLRATLAESLWNVGRNSEAWDHVLAVLGEDPEHAQANELAAFFVDETPDPIERMQREAEVREARGGTTPR